LARAPDERCVVNHRLKQQLQDLVWSVWRPARPALYEMDRRLEHHLGNAPGYFIEVGANDGYQQSNTYYLERHKGWRGLLVEGIPELYERCRRLRTRSTVVSCALVSPSHTGSTVTMHYAHLMSVVEGSLKSLQAQSEHIGTGRQHQGVDQPYSVEVPARTLEAVLDGLPDVPPIIDLLSLDVEGYELDVLQGLNLDRYAPRWILVEARFFEEVDAYLQPLYELIERFTHHDCLYRLRAGAAPSR
jgi:FkbM family methyltransferase